MKLFTIGDSISQGFMSLAAARTELCYSTLIARCMGLTPGTDKYPIPLWGAGGLPFNIESLFRTLQREYGSNILGPIEWSLAAATINKFLNQVEDYYERGSGNLALPQAGDREFYPNVSVSGFTVADAWMVTPALCVQRIIADAKDSEDGLFDIPNCGFERTAHAVLNPSRDQKYNNYSQLEWLRHHHTTEGVENLIIWLGSNNALGTIVRMGVKSTKDSEKHPLKMDLTERNEFNLWTSEHFKDEFEELVKRINAIIADGKCDTNVFVSTVPPVTVAPLALGLEPTHEIPDPFGIIKSATYFDRYTYFLFDKEYARRSGHSLSFQEMHEIDKTINEYNVGIRAIVEQYNDAPRVIEKKRAKYVMVGVAEQLLQLAYKRNNGNPTYAIPEKLKNHIENMGKPVNTIYYNTDRQGKMTSGGIFSLDGVHPTAIGHGLIAHEFIKTMKENGVKIDNELDWDTIVASDSLYSNPISLMPELYDNTKLAEMILQLLRLP